MADKIKIIVIGGPTGVGKSETAVEVAKLLSGEIISADSVQVFKYFDIGSGKPSLELRDAVPHHLIDFLEPDENFSLWDFKESARKIILEIIARGNRPILTGGTGLYIKAVLENLEGGTPAEPELRASLLGNIESEGTEELYEWLIRLDPSKSAKIHPNDKHRIIRGIENALLKKKEKEKKENQAELYDVSYFVLGGERESLYSQINSRVLSMFNRGWVKETESILERGFKSDCKAFNSVGYKQIVARIEGEGFDDNLLQDVQRQTRRYAKRQMTWFNSIKNAEVIDIFAHGNSPPEIAKIIATIARQEV